MINAFGDKIRNFRRKRKWTLAKVSEILGVDQALISKAERGIRTLTRAQVIKLAQAYEVSAEVLLIPWMADKVATVVGTDRAIASEILLQAEEVIAFRNYHSFNFTKNFQDLVDVFARFSAIEAAWVFGSFAQKRVTPYSDVNVLIKTTPEFSYFDLAEVQHKLENRIGRPVDIGWEDVLHESVRRRIKEELLLVYEKV